MLTSPTMKRFKKVFVLLICMLAGTLQGFSQGENNIWINNYAFVSVNFNAGTDPSFGDISLSPVWSGYNVRTASVCDSSGNLLFYTNGREIYTRSGVAMPHSGIELPTPNYALTPTLIMKMPASTSEYYVFTLSSNDTDYAILYYSVVDLSLNNGDGDVDVSRKNIQVRTGLMQSFLIGEQGEDCNMWLSVREKDKNTIITYPVSASGLGQPVLSVAGFHINTPQLVNTIGISSCMFGRKSNDGRKMTMTAMEFNNGTTYTASMQLLNFDKATGKFTDDLVLFQHVAEWYWYNFHPSCFSPDDTKLYTTDLQNVNNPGKIVQYDLGQPTAAAIRQSKTIVDVFPPPQGGSTAQSYVTDMRLGPDNRIYIALTTPTAPARINNPDLAGTACGVQHDLMPPLSPFSVPVFFAEKALIPLQPDHHDLLGADTQLCQGQELLLQLKQTDGVTYTWQDGTQSSNYKVQKEGIYTVTRQSECGLHTDSMRVAFQACGCHIIAAPDAFSPNSDGLNDMFLPLTDCGTNIRSYYLSIYDRWGAVIFSTTDARRGWTGYKGNIPADIGTYFYTVRIVPQDDNRTPLFKKGDFILLR